MGELYYIVSLVDGEVMKTTDRAVAEQYIPHPEYVVINHSLGVYYDTNKEECGIPYI